MEGHSHDAVGRIEGLLNAVAVVNVDVDVEHTSMVAEQLKNGQNDIWKRQKMFASLHPDRHLRPHSAMGTQLVESFNRRRERDIPLT